MNPRFQNKKRKKYLDPATLQLIRQVALGVGIFACIAIVISIVWYGTRLESFTVSTITAEGGVTIDAQEVKSAVETELAGTYLGLVPKRFAFFYPEEKVLARVAQVERIKDVNVERVSNTEVAVTYDEYIPDTLWCSLKEEDKCLFLDEDGYAFAPAPVLRGESVVRYHTLERDIEQKAQPFLPIDYATTKEFTKLLRDIDWYVTKIEVSSTRDAFYTIAGGGELRTTLTEAAATPFDNLAAILGSEEFGDIVPGKFQYIDLRFGSRVFVNEELAVTEVATSTATSTDEVVPSEPEVVE